MKARSTLRAILNIAGVRLYDTGRDDEHMVAGKLLAIALYREGLDGVTFEARPDGFCLEIENPLTFYNHALVAEHYHPLLHDRPMTALGGEHPVLRTHYSLEDYRQVLITMGDSREPDIAPSALQAFVGALRSWAPANDASEEWPQMATG